MGDGVQNLWNIWHMRQSIATGSSPYFTSYLHFPEGTTLLAHTLSPTNALMGAALESFLSPFEAYNTLVILTFVATGLSGFLLAYYFCRSYWPSVVAGFIYSFSGFQMLHIGSHINLTSLEWLPLFVIFWHRLLSRPGLRSALLAAFFLTIAFYTEIYSFFNAALLGLVFICGFMVKQGVKHFANHKHLAYIGLFLLIVLTTIGPFIFALIATDRADPFRDNHNPVAFSTDALGPLMPGFLKDWHWHHAVTGEGVGESFLGLSVLLLIVFAVVRHRRIPDIHKSLGIWLAALVVFYLFSLGPVLHMLGTVLHVPMPYSLLTTILPMLKLGAMPNHMMVVAILAAAVISAMALAEVLKSRGKPWPIFGAIAFIIFFEYLPAQPFRPTQPQVAIPAYVYALKNLPGKEAVFDNTSKETLLYQTVHERPIFGGYISRRPSSVVAKDRKLEQAYYAGNYKFLCDSGFRYLVTDGKTIEHANLVFSDNLTRVYDLATYDSNCRAPLQPRQ